MPLEYMLAVLRNPQTDAARRDKMAIAAAPFVHPRTADKATGRKAREAAAALELDPNSPMDRLLMERAARLKADAEGGMR